MSAALLSEILACEHAVWQALQDGDAAADKAALAADFLGVYPDGFSGRTDHIGQLANGPSIATFEISDTHIRHVPPDHALLSYRADFIRAGSEISEAMYVSSLWRRFDSGWINVFSQDTPAMLI
ncbi:MAG: nuclear transport factor 2 family protein [Pseudomonadota bacterium]